jgi:exonuclease III
MMNIISWNCRGLGRKFKTSQIRDLVKEEKPHLLMIQETKLEDNQVLQELKHMWRECEGLAFRSRGASRGICTLWNPHILRITNWQKMQH